MDSSSSGGGGAGKQRYKGAWGRSIMRLNLADFFEIGAIKQKFRAFVVGPDKLCHRKTIFRVNRSQHVVNGVAMHHVGGDRGGLGTSTSLQPC